MSRKKELKKAKKAARQEVMDLLRRYGRKPMDQARMLHLLEQVSQAVGLDTSRTNRLVRRAGKAFEQQGIELKVGHTIWIKGEPAKVTKLTDKSVTYETEEETKRIGKARLFRAQEFICDKASIDMQITNFVPLMEKE